MSWTTAISSDQLQLSELYKFTYTDGSIEYFTTFESNITWGSNVYLAVPFTRTTGRKESDLSVGYITINIPRTDDYTQTAKLLNRYLDNTEVLITWIDRKDHANYRVAFLGKVGEVAYNLTSVTMNVKNDLNLFNKEIPRRMYCEGCNLEMYGKYCKLVKASHEETGTAEAGSTTTIINDSSRAEADEYFDLGYIEMTSGVNNGEQRSVFSYEVGIIEVDEPFSNTVGIGDTYKMYPHCKKTYEKCRDDYSNQLNYGGFEDIPDAVEALI